jgi:Zn-dependent metalloprotease
MKPTYSFLLTLGLSSLALLGQAKNYTGADAERLVAGADRVIMSDQLATLQFVHYREHAGPKGEHRTWLKKITNLGPDADFQLYQTETDKQGWVHYRYRQLYKNVLVEDGVIYVHTKNDEVLSVNGELYGGIAINAVHSISERAAFNIAKAAMPATLYSWEDKNYPVTPDASKLMIYRVPKRGYVLTWKVDMFAFLPEQQRSFFYIDAVTGKIAGQKERIHHIDTQGIAITAYSGQKPITTDSIGPNQYRLRETGRGGGIVTNDPSFVDQFDTDNNWNNVNAQLDHYCTDAHYSAEVCYDYLFNNFGLNAQDGNGMQIRSQIHDGAYVNAFWNGTYMAYGDGDGINYTPLTSLEIAAHEYMHGVTEFSAGLVYAGESGAMNESYSDIMGATMRFIETPSTATWYIGDQIVVPNSSGTPFRDMSNPNAFGCADTYGGLYFNAGDIVHYDSGIQNFMYYLLVTGGTGINDVSNNYAVTGIGLTDAMAIMYRSLDVYLTPNSTFLDSRTYSEQAAVDLFGQCSNELIQTANAWYAVGVGGVFSGSVVSNFIATPTVSCTAPANVSFINQSWNGTNFQWNFGDNTTSTATSPTHTYANPGTYTVTLVATGTGNCVGIDTLVRNAYITVNNVPGPVAASCTPATTNYCCGHGITNVMFNTINWNSNDAVDNYSDFTCADSTLLVAGSTYPISISTLTSNAADEGVKVWIDYNNDGSFNNATELAFQSANSGFSGLHSGYINTPLNATLNTRLRMRVISDVSSNNITSACYSPQRGQVEDYMVYFVANALPPVANFTANITTVVVGGSVNFQDISLNAPATWNWTFTGGNPSSSAIQNPNAIAYNTAGLYPVKLVVSNIYGADSATQISYINVVNIANICQNQTMTSPGGILYDSGGPNGNYLDNQNCTFLIDPACPVTNLTATISLFDLEYSYDYLTIYDGNSNAGPVLFTGTGQLNNIPPVVSTTGMLFVVFTSDISVVYSGFELTWTSTVVAGPSPVSAFTAVPNNPQSGSPVAFTDQSTNSPIYWSWNFGDNTTSTLQNPTHTYTNAGTYTVTLIATNCNGSDTTTFVITVTPNGVSEYVFNDEFNLFPNPFSASTTLLLSENLNPSELTVQVTDLTGRTIISMQPNSRRVEIGREGMSTGVYFLEIWSEGKRVGLRKMIVQ